MGQGRRQSVLVMEEKFGAERQGLCGKRSKKIQFPHLGIRDLQSLSELDIRVGRPTVFFVSEVLVFFFKV